MDNQLFKLKPVGLNMLKSHSKQKLLFFTGLNANALPTSSTIDSMVSSA